VTLDTFVFLEKISALSAVGRGDEAQLVGTLGAVDV
jgi:hypothetical protein